MSLESFMLKDEVKEVEYVASNRFKDKELTLYPEQIFKYLF